MEAAMHPEGFKYAALIFPGPPEPKESRVVHDGKETFVGRLSSLVPARELRHWREWVGSIAWREMESEQRIVVTRAPSTAPTVLDGEDQHLRGRTANSWRAFTLAVPRVYAGGGSWLISGQAQSDQLGAPLLSVRSASRLEPIVRPIYSTRDKFWNLHMEAVKQQLLEHGHPDESWLPVFVEVDGFLCSGPWSDILGYSLLAHGSAVTRRELEFAIPELVRAAEGVIALERNMGAKVFTERALRLAPVLRGDKYVGDDLDALLLELYQARSDCVHGKVPFLTLRSRGDQGEERAAQLAYVADVLARSALLCAIRFRDQTIFGTREQLEQAWAAGTFPG